MTTLEALIYATFHAHTVQGWGEDTPNEWKYLCKCGELGDDHEEHMARMIARLVVAPEVPAPIATDPEQLVLL